MAELTMTVDDSPILTGAGLGLWNCGRVGMGRGGFSFLPSLDGRKVPSQIAQVAMPFTKSSDEELDRIATAALALLRTQPDNLVDHPHGHTFRDIERAAHEVGRRVATRMTEAALATHAQDQPDHAPCPGCGGGTRLTRKKRTVDTADGPVEYDEPASHCVVCRRDFFPDAARTETRRAVV